jgi:hypothetical protein
MHVCMGAVEEYRDRAGIALLGCSREELTT